MKNFGLSQRNHRLLVIWMIMALWFIAISGNAQEFTKTCDKFVPKSCLLIPVNFDFKTSGSLDVLKLPSDRPYFFTDAKILSSTYYLQVFEYRKPLNKALPPRIYFYSVYNVGSYDLKPIYNGIQSRILGFGGSVTYKLLRNDTGFFVISGFTEKREVYYLRFKKVGEYFAGFVYFFDDNDYDLRSDMSAMSAGFR